MARVILFAVLVAVLVLAFFGIVRLAKSLFGTGDQASKLIGAAIVALLAFALFGWGLAPGLLD